jgi:hypothetical protein
MIRSGFPCGAAGGANKKARLISGNHPKAPKQFPVTKALTRARSVVYHRIGKRFMRKPGKKETRKEGNKVIRQPGNKGKNPNTRGYSLLPDALSLMSMP